MRVYSVDLLNIVRESFFDYLTTLFSLLNDPVYYGVGVSKGHNESILLVPGFMEGDYSLIPMDRWLSRIGYHPYLSGIGWNVGCPGDKLEQLARRIDAIVHDNGSPVTVVGHSLGGMLGRRLAAMRPGVIRHVITLGSPTRIEPGVIRQEIGPALAECQGLWRIFADPAHECGTTKCTCGIPDLLSDCSVMNCGISSIFTRSDDIVDWRTCLVAGGANYEVSGRHCSLIVNPKVYHVIATILAKSARIVWSPNEPEVSHARVSNHFGGRFDIVRFATPDRAATAVTRTRAISVKIVVSVRMVAKSREVRRVICCGIRNSQGLVRVGQI
jgi:triacylglycerol lipase